MPSAFATESTPTFPVPHVRRPLKPGHTERVRGNADWFPLVNSLVVATPNPFCIAASRCHTRFAKCQKKKRQRGRVFGVAGAFVRSFRVIHVRRPLVRSTRAFTRCFIPITIISEPCRLISQSCRLRGFLFAQTFSAAVDFKPLLLVRYLTSAFRAKRCSVLGVLHQSEGGGLSPTQRQRRQERHGDTRRPLRFHPRDLKSSFSHRDQHPCTTHSQEFWLTSLSLLV